MRRFFAMKPSAVATSTTAGSTTAKLHAHSHCHGGHAHTHSHGGIEKGISGKYLRQCQLATLAGGATNVFFCVTKLWSGSAGGSVALVADGFHALTDILADIISYVAISLSRKKLPRCRFPLGIGRLETSGAVIVSAILLFGGVALLLQSLEQCFSDVASVLDTAVPTGGIAAALACGSRRGIAALRSNSTSAESLGGHGHAHGSHNDIHEHHGGGDHQGHSHFQVMAYDEGIGKQVILWTMVGISTASVVCKEILFRWTRRVGLLAGSRVVVANAYHHRADAWSGGVALLGVAGQVMGLPGVDGLAGLAVSLSICNMGYGIFKGSVLEFFDYQNAEEISVIREQLQLFNVRIVRGADVVLNQKCQNMAKAAATGEAALSTTSSTTASSSDEDDTVQRKKIHFINVFLVRHGHQYAMHVTLLVHKSVSAQKIKEATDLITELASRSLPVQDTFTTLLVCSNHTEPREGIKDGDHGNEGIEADGGADTSNGTASADCHGHVRTGCSDSFSRAHSGDDTAASVPPIAATGAIINPSLEQCIASLQEFHTFKAPIRYSWEERTITAPSSESCECERDISSVAEMFKCRLISRGATSVNKASDNSAERSRQRRLPDTHADHSH
ncbi:cation transporter, putative [Leishmania tarentolae]|uniref:Cation transporter, putative n=1 Tax=Leishmania tarentolae TaxID=5689 RepID=A0A640KF13_LEITA|nr:cation transporter, putative [Leishmania tarentolae]